jgi:hypothetical protein
MTKLAVQIERMAASAEKLEQSYSAQVDVVQKLASAFSGIDVTSAVAGIEALNKTLGGMQDKMKDAGKTSESTFSRLAGAAEKTGKSLSQKFPKSVAVATGALLGFKQGVANVLALGKGVIGFASTFVDWFGNIAASVISFPLKMFEAFIDLAAKSGGGMDELAVAIEKLRAQFGYLTGPTNKAIISTSKELKGFSDTGLSAWRVFGTLAERLDYLREIATEMGGTFGVVRKEFEENGGAILAYQKGLGISKEDMKGIGRNAISMGQKTTVALKDMTKQSYALGDAFGLDAKLISRDMSKAMTDVKHFGGATVKSIGEASAYARKLGLELKDITGTLDAFETFDSAAENAAKLSQAFGTNIDAFKMMEEQDPGKQLDMLRKSFRDAGVDASNFNRAQLKLVTGATGLDESTVKTALSMKNQGASMSEIQKKSGEAEKKTMTQAQAMGTLADAIERMTKSGVAQKGGFWDMFVHGFLGGIQQSKEFRTIMVNIKRALEETYRQGVRLGRMFVDMFPGVQDFLGGIGDFFQPAKFKTMVGGVVDVLRDWMAGLTSDNGPASFGNLMDKIQGKFFDFFNSETSSGKRMITGFKTFLKTIATVIAEGIKLFIPKITEGLKSVTELITDPKKFLAGAKSGGSAGMSIVMEIIDPIIKAFDNPVMMNNLWKAIKGFASVLFDKLMDLLYAGAKAMPVKGWVAIGAVLFGPAVGQALLGAGINVVGGALKSIFIKSAEKALVDKAVSAAFEKTTSTLVSKGVEAASTTATQAVSKSATSAASGGAGVSKLASLLANPYVLVAVAAVAITVGAFALAKTSMKNEAEKLQDVMDDEEFLEKLEQKNNTVTDRIKILKEERLKQAKKADDEAGIGVLSFLRGGMSEQEADARAKMKSINEQLQEAKLKADRELIVGTPEYQAKMQQAATENKKRILEAMGPVTIENAAERFKKVGDLAKQVTGKDFDLADKMKMIREKLDSVDFAIFGSKEKEDKLNLALSALSSVKALFGVIGDVGNLSAKATSSVKMIDNKSLKESFESLKTFGDTVLVGIVDPKFIERLQMSATYSKSAAVNTAAISDGLKNTFTSVNEVDTAIKATKNFAQTNVKGAFQAALGAIKDMVKVANDLDTALADGRINKIDIKTKLQNVANAVGLGGKATYTVNPSKEVQITVNLHVTMDADKVERVIIERSQSIIRDRLNFATNNPTQKGNSEISDTAGATPKLIKPEGTKN